MERQFLEVGSHFSAKIGFIYVFNLIVGTGALTMPRAFGSAGWLLSVIGIILLAFMSYLTLTFVIEAMGIANAVLKLDQLNTISKVQDDEEVEEGEEKPLVRPQSESASYGTAEVPEVEFNSTTSYENLTGNKLSVITHKVEMGDMAARFYPYKFQLLIFYFVLCIYLFGDLAIYAAAVPKSLRDVVCTYSGIVIENVTDDTDHHCNRNLTDDDLCWTSIKSISRLDAYRILLAVFVVCLGPFFFFNVQKTKYLQMFTATMRWLSFSVMIVLAVIQLSKHKGEGHPPVASFAELPTLFGVCVYSFMCHHSLPSMVAPIKEKSHLFPLFGGDYLLILIFYSVLSFTGVFTFSQLQDLYTLNFFCDDSKDPITDIAFLQYFLALFPVFTLSTNFPIIGVTLRNNLKTLGYIIREQGYPLEQVIFPLLALIPPFAIAFATSNVEFLVSITGSYAGAGIQYMIPVGLVFYGRKVFKIKFGEDAVNFHCSPFKHYAWLILVVIWFTLSVVLVTVHHIIDRDFL